MLKWMQKSWLLVAVVIAGLILYGDTAALRITIFNLSAVGLVLLLVDLLLDRRKEWGIFPTLDIDATLERSTSTPLSAALTWIGVVILVVAIMVLAVPRLSVGATIPDNAKTLLPVLSTAINQQWPGAPLRSIPAGQVEQESSWKEKATLKTSRELGRGLVQLTIAYKTDGTERFNAYKDASHVKALAAWDWRKDPFNTHYQLTYLTLTDRANFMMVRKYMVDDTEAWKAALVCYNAGEGRWLARRAMAKQMGLPTNRWTNGLEQAHGVKENAILYGRALYVAVNEYPRVIFQRAEKYQGNV